jgi:hypothetical protein
MSGDFHDIFKAMAKHGKLTTQVCSYICRRGGLVFCVDSSDFFNNLDWCVDSLTGGTHPCLECELKSCHSLFDPNCLSLMEV